MKANKLLESLKGFEKIELKNFELEAEEAEELRFTFLTSLTNSRVSSKEPVSKLPFNFSPPKDKYKLKISEVTLGATKTTGGTRKSTLTVGGESAMPFYFFEGNFPNKPAISQDIFDLPIPLPRAVRKYFPNEVMEDPVEWAKFRVEKLNAKAISLHMISTDPNLKNTSVKEACKIIEEVLQAIKVPLIIGGSGNPEKDPKLLEKAAEVCSGERVLLSSVDPEMDYKRVVKAALKYDHPLLSLISMNPDETRRFNKNLMKEGMSRENLLMDLFTGGVGYGIEYSISTMERCRLRGLKGDTNLAIPIVSATSNAWSAREAWMENKAWGERELRGPLWEAITAIIALLSGADLLMMLHPKSIKATENFLNLLFTSPQT